MTTTRLSLSNATRAGILLILALVMLATRSNHFGALPDASWAVFFVAGFYLARDAGARASLRGLFGTGSARWIFALLMALGVLIDYVVISRQGLSFWSHYCVSPAYWFLLPSYAAMWLGGAWLRQQYNGLHARELGLLFASTLVAASVCFLLSNGSFYWLSPSVTAPSFGGWMQNLGDWYVPYMRTTLMYVGIATALHAATTLAAQSLATSAGQRTQLRDR